MEVGATRMFPLVNAHFRSNADVAQLVEHHLAKVRVASSNLVIRSNETPAFAGVSSRFAAVSVID
jgi:hypothetical protein